IRWRTVPGWRIDLSGAYRERNGRVAARPVGAGLVSPGQGALRGAARAEYDLEREAWTRLQAQGQWRHGSGAELEFQYVDRTPQVDAASWFARFTDFERIRLARATARRRWPSGFGGEIEAWGSFVGDRSSTRLGLAALVPGGRIGYSVRTGDTGEENCWYGEWGTQVHPRVRVEGEASLLTWALVEDAPADQDRDVTTLAGRVRWDVGTGWQLRAEVQSLANTIYDQDVRFLVGLDVFGAAGSSRYGLGTGRSLP
ncbi:hypothetical protein KDM41_17940, partial [bacterium]|nr:hypothetical protein [bacterium]